MTDKEKIRSVVARFFNVPESAVTENFVFPPERLNASVGRATFHAAIKRMAGADLPAAFKAKTFGELFGETEASATAGESTKIESANPSPVSGFGVGIDIEHCDNLPAASDFWAEPFYAENFTAAEIAYCQRQPDPRGSFCGLWCAKEAVMKCGAEFFKRRPLELEIQHDANGRPFLSVLREGRWAKERGCDISISHSRGATVAVCVLRVVRKT